MDLNESGLIVVFFVAVALITLCLLVYNLTKEYKRYNSKLSLPMVIGYVFCIGLVLFIISGSIVTYNMGRIGAC